MKKMANDLFLLIGFRNHPKAFSGARPCAGGIPLDLLDEIQCTVGAITWETNSVQPAAHRRWNPTPETARVAAPALLLSSLSIC